MYAPRVKTPSLLVLVGAVLPGIAGLTVDPAALDTVPSPGRLGRVGSPDGNGTDVESVGTDPIGNGGRLTASISLSENLLRSNRLIRSRRIVEILCERIRV